MRGNLANLQFAYRLRAELRTVHPDEPFELYKVRTTFFYYKSPQTDAISAIRCIIQFPIFKYAKQTELSF